jgi:hypothetical protein
LKLSDVAGGVDQLDAFPVAWDLSHMETVSIVTADAKSRVTIRGVQQGDRFRLEKDASGFHLAPVLDTTEPRRRNPSRRNLPAPKRGLVQYLQEMRNEGLVLEPVKHPPAGPCRF